MVLQNTTPTANVKPNDVTIHRVRLHSRKMLIGTIGALAALNLFGPSIRGLMPNNLPLFDPEGQESGFGLFRTLTLTITDYDTSQETDIPAFYDNYANVWDTITQEDQPMLFFVTRTGVRTLRKILGSCLGMCLASNVSQLMILFFVRAMALILLPYRDAFGL